MRKVKNKDNLKAFSLFELVVTMGVLMSLTIIVFPIATQQAQITKLESRASQIVDDLSYQQQISYLKGFPSGIKIESNKYTMYTGEDLASSTDIDSRSLPGSISIVNINITLDNTVSFEEGNFKPTSYGDFTITDGFYSFRVYINEEGLIRYEEI